jgi:hypothetical protein
LVSKTSLPVEKNIETPEQIWGRRYMKGRSATTEPSLRA